MWLAQGRMHIEPEPRHHAADMSECLCCATKLFASVLLQRPAMLAHDDSNKIQAVHVLKGGPWELNTATMQLA